MIDNRDVPISPAFIDFLHGELLGDAVAPPAWYRQETEELLPASDTVDGIDEKSAQVFSSKTGRMALAAAHRLFKDLLVGDLRSFHRVLSQYHFVFVVGPPRTGGTYITKQMLRAVGIDYTSVSADLAHDGFPDLSRLRIKNKMNLQTAGMMQLCEFVVMCDMFYRNRSVGRIDNRIVVPKKFTKAIYQYDLLRAVFADHAEYIVTFRHPLAFCKSVVDKSGGFPEDGLFRVRSAIERWAYLDALHHGRDPRSVMGQGYLEVLIGYWRRFYSQLSLNGLMHHPRVRTVVFGRDPVTRFCEEFLAGVGHDIELEPFFDAQPPEFGAVAQEHAASALADVDGLWRGMGHTFPRLPL